MEGSWTLGKAENRITATSGEGLAGKESAQEAIGYFRQCAGQAGVRISG